MRIGEIWNKFISGIIDAFVKLNELWFSKSHTRLYSPTFDRTRVYIDERTIDFPTLYSGTSAQARMESLGLNVEQYREYINTYLERAIQEHYNNTLVRIGEMRFESSLFRKKKDPGAPYNKYPIVKTKFLDGYEPNKI